MASGAYWLGILILFGTHIYMLVTGELPEAQMTMHAWSNIVAGLLIGYGYMNKK